ncbi:hypothetical protein [Paraburkholderia flagellata]|uniref:hypothetical protein n=1 Tax=Paraburkholderia flagellata TaxID=2883241 RepID=UPI001F35F3BE|nr:hypothetical protein [Paraburkholderia flagellata]
MCSPDLLARAGSVEALTQAATLTDSPLSRAIRRDWCGANSLPMTDRPRHSFDLAALAISAAARRHERRASKAHASPGANPHAAIGWKWAPTASRVFYAKRISLRGRATDIERSRLAAFRQWLLAHASPGWALAFGCIPRGFPAA